MSVLQSKKQQLVAENPFYGKSLALAVFQQLPKVDDAKVQKSAIFTYLDNAWSELRSTLEGRKLFFSLLFSVGDIENREHNIFRKRGMKDVDQGGSSKRRSFIFCLEWVLTYTPEQFYRFLPVIGEYYNLDGYMMYELRTDRFKGNLLETLKLPVDVRIITEYISSILRDARTTPNERKMWAKWLPHIPSNKRKRTYEITDKNIKSFHKGGNRDLSIGDRLSVSKEKKSHTKDKDNWTFTFIKVLSEKMSWEVIKHKNNVEFSGYKSFKKQYLGDTEAHMFSSHKIKTLDKAQLIEWFNQLPSDARFRTARRIVNKDKSTGKLTPGEKWITDNGTNIGAVYIEWLSMKETAQQTVRNLTPEAKAALAPTELKQLEKAAKVNTGATNLLDLFARLMQDGQSDDEINTIAHSILEQIKLDIPALVIGDISGSMTSSSVEHKGLYFTASRMLQLASTVFLLKNPDPTLQDMMVRFGTNAQVVSKGTSVTSKAGNNRFGGQMNIIVDFLVDKTKPFTYNLASMARYTQSTDGSTNLDSVSKSFKTWVDSEPAFKSQRTEQINQYQVFLVISDGDINSHDNAAQSVLAFQRDMMQWFGWNGVIVIWDVKGASGYGRGETNKFEGLNNIMYFGGTNYAIVNQIFKNINDLDIIDQYLPLKTLSLSNRYEPVRALVS